MKDASSPTIHDRLEEERIWLEKLDAECDSGANPALSRAAADRIVWRELLELELQDIDEQIERVREGLPSPPAR